ncbi:unnamed protein product [Cylindrotheca closterium]|uniref:Uncharacterized protein n=1 Tax=Cylindrotheca closterium TaxID=2856 RepID=A0AAD2JJZ9_9STRA|nr:unnamed protein product [Cylindrotheca closterium]
MADQQDAAFADIAQTLQVLQQMLAVQGTGPKKGGFTIDSQDHNARSIAPFCLSFKKPESEGDEAARKKAAVEAAKAKMLTPIDESTVAPNARDTTTALLANALAMIGQDDALHDIISEALSALHQT